LAEHSISEVRRSNEKGSHANVGFGFGARKSFESHGADTHSTTSTKQRSHRSKVRLWQGVIEYTLGNLWRQLVLLKQIKSWSLTGLRAAVGKDAAHGGSTAASRVGEAKPIWTMEGS
jgi:hypothetical protein